MHHGEVEDLPEFVHSRADTFTKAMWQTVRDNQKSEEKRGIIPPHWTGDTPAGCGFCEVMDWVPVAGTSSAVTQKLETPVIYFYSDAGIKEVNVAVDFPQGIVTEVYPQTSLNLPLVGKVSTTAGGHAEWNVTIHPIGTSLDVPFVTSTNIWAPSRRVTANMVSTRGAQAENEHHIFYRGLGNWDGPVAVTSTRDELVVHNLGTEVIPSVWVLASDGNGKGLIRCLCNLDAYAQVSTPLEDGTFPLKEYIDMELYLIESSIALEMELVKAGLYPLEARAMVDTWSASYFKSRGIRVLYIAPQVYPDLVLPWEITPTPSEELRVLVGRVEVILKSEEESLLPIALRLINNNYLDVAVKSEDLEVLRSLGRFADSKIRRVVGDKVDSALLEKWIINELTY